MLPAMAKKPSIAIVGPGRLGTLLAGALSAAGYGLDEIISRSKQSTIGHMRSVRSSGARLNADLIWFCVPDREVAHAARQLAGQGRWKGKLVFHSSGVLTSDELDVLRRQGASVASVHPLMTFVRRSQVSMRGIPFGIEGDPAAVRAARRIVHDLGGEAFSVRKRDKVLYHAWGTFTSPLLIALLVAAEQVARSAGVSPAGARKKALPILRKTLENYAAFGPAQSFSGPIVRGDVGTVRGHLRALKKVPELREVYAALARVALCHLPSEDRRGLEKVLKGKGRPS